MYRWGRQGCRILITAGAALGGSGVFEPWGFDRSGGASYGIEQGWVGIALCLLAFCSLIANVSAETQRLAQAYSLAGMACAGVGLVLALQAWRNGGPVPPNVHVFPTGIPLLDYGPARCAIGFAANEMAQTLLFFMRTAFFQPESGTGTLGGGKG